MKNASMSGAVALVGIGLITIGLGNFFKAPDAHAGVPLYSAGQSTMIGITLDPVRGSGRWNQTLLAVDANGKVFALDTSQAKSAWKSFQYSP